MSVQWNCLGRLNLPELGRARLPPSRWPKLGRSLARPKSSDQSWKGCPVRLDLPTAMKWLEAPLAVGLRDRRCLAVADTTPVRSCPAHGLSRATCRAQLPVHGESIVPYGLLAAMNPSGGRSYTTRTPVGVMGARVIAPPNCRFMEVAPLFPPSRVGKAAATGTLCRCQIEAELAGAHGDAS